MEDRGIEVMHMDGVLGHVKAEGVGLAIGNTRFDADASGLGSVGMTPLGAEWAAMNSPAGTAGRIASGLLGVAHLNLG